MTADLTLAVDLAAPAAEVYDLLATPEGVRRWWTAGADGDRHEGGTLHVRFREGHWLDMRLRRLTPGREVVWDCVAQQEPGFSRPDEWVGTSVRFTLEDRPDGNATLHFTHHGLAALDCHEVCRRGWSFYVGESLPALVATGTGRPDTPSDARGQAQPAVEG